MDQLAFGRALMGDTLGFHILFALFGVGIPLLISLAELISIIKKDADFRLMAERWSYPMSVLFITGAVSGTIVMTQFNILWPGFMSFAGKIIGVPLSFESYAFFVEAIFLGIYLYTWKRFKNPWLHWLCSLPIILGSFASAFLITTANAFMNEPQGFTLVNGALSNINPWQAMFNAATPTETSHSISAYYATTCLVFAGCYAVILFKRPITDYYKKAMLFLLSLSLLFACLVGLTGDRSAKFIARYEPIKFAAAEALFETQTNAPLQIGGVIHNNSLTKAIKVPGFLSWLAYGSRSATVKGLLAFDPQLWPPLFVHYMFDAMAIIGGMIVGVPALMLGLYIIRKRTLAFAKPLLLLLVLTGFLAICAIEFGWILTEVGRQPFIIRGIMKTSEAFTTNQTVMTFSFIYPLLYVVLFIATGYTLVRHYKKASHGTSY